MAPGESTVVELIFATHNYRGKVSKSARIQSNDVTAGPISISFVSYVYPSADSLSPLVFSPPSLEFNQNQRKQTLTIQNVGSQTVEVSFLDGQTENLKWKLRNKSIKPGGTDQLECEWKGGFPPAGLTGSLTFSTSDSAMSRFTIPYRVTNMMSLTPAPVPQPKTGSAEQPRKTEPARQSPATPPPIPPGTRIWPGLLPDSSGK